MAQQSDQEPDRTLLAPSLYDDDAASLRTLSDQDSDSEDDEVQQVAQTSLELAEHDLRVLKEEEEREKLLVQESTTEGLRRIFSGGLSNTSKVKIGKRQRRKGRRKHDKEWDGRKREVGGGDDHDEMIEMEQGALLRSDEDTSSFSETSSDLDRRKFGDVFGEKRETSRCLKFSLLFAAIIVLFLIMFLVAYQLSRKPFTEPVLATLSNGTELFAPTTILISLDGFRADFLYRNITPTLNQFVKQGISPRYMLPSFPSVTFPNHFTLVTGLYPESHGVVGNTFWDPHLLEEFYYTDPARSMDPKWWNGEPVWVTAENAGVRTAIHMWPGSEAHIGGVEPSFLDRYNGKELLSNKVDRILGLLDMPSSQGPNSTVITERPQLIAAYVPNVDAAGHEFGPNSTEIMEVITNVDDMLTDLFHGLEQRNLSDIVNVIVVSDHGMATTSTDRLLQLDDLIDMNSIEHTDGWPLYGLRPKNPADIRPLYDQLKSESQILPNFDVYLRDEDMPARYHFTNNDRIAPLWIVPKTGWAIVVKSEFNVKEAKASNTVYHPRGIHGYDHENPLMRAIFVARGPSFPHKPNSKVEPFQNTEVYNIVCDTLGISPKPNNGTLRLPLKPVGLHSDPAGEPNPPSDLPSAGEDGTLPGIGISDPNIAPDRPTVDDEGKSEVDEESKSKLEKWAEFFKKKFDGAKSWFSNLLPDKKEGSEGGG